MQLVRLNFSSSFANTHGFFEEVISGQDEGSISALLLDNDPVDIRQLGRVEPCRPKAAILEDQNSEAVRQVGVLEAGGSEIGN